MSGKPQRHDPYTFSRAAYDELRDTEIGHNMHLQVQLEPTTRKGIWTIHVSAWALETPPGGPCACSWHGDWPNSQLQTFEAFVYAAVHRVARMCEEYRTNEAKHAAGRENRR